MIYALLGTVVGMIIGGFLPLSIPPEYARYTAVAILGVFDSLLGAIRAERQNEFNGTIFISGILFNMILAAAITYLGDKLSLDLYLAVIIVFTLRIFGNLSTIRHLFLARILGSKRAQKEIETKTL